MAALIAVLVCLPFGSPRAQSPTVTRVNDLDFGMMFPGVPIEIDKQSADAVEFQVTGTADAEVTLDFSLPQYLSVGGYNMQLIFYTTSCAIDTNATPDQSSPAYVDLNPWQTLTYRLASSGLTVWLGCKAVPGLQQEAGTYTGDVVLTVQYTGN